MAVIICDLDGTICTEEKTFSRSMAIPLDGVVEALSELRNKGNKIIVYSARSWAEYEMTERWLNDNSVPYDQLVLGKPIGDYWIDDRAVEFTSWAEVMGRVAQ